MLKVILYTRIPCFIVQILAIASLTMTTQTGVLNIMGFFYGFGHIVGNIRLLEESIMYE